MNLFVTFVLSAFFIVIAAVILWRGRLSWSSYTVIGPTLLFAGLGVLCGLAGILLLLLIFDVIHIP